MDITLELSKDPERQEKCKVPSGSAQLVSRTPLPHPHCVCSIQLAHPSSCWVPCFKLCARSSCPHSHVSYRFEKITSFGGLICGPNKIKVPPGKGKMKPRDLLQMGSWLKAGFDRRVERREGRCWRGTHIQMHAQV